MIDSRKKTSFVNFFTKKAKQNKIRARSWFKLDEINCKYNLFKPNMNVVDLGASPGSWSQYAINKIKPNGKVIACDILYMYPINGVKFIQGDFCNNEVFYKLIKTGRKNIQLILSDAAPNISGISLIDNKNFYNLLIKVILLCRKILIKNGNLVIKIFQGREINRYIKVISLLFNDVKISKPVTSKSKSREIYIIGIKYKF
ncbi:MAG: RlmE family RNA methyltransferase [Candidatus Lightella neohaematopini]|nr:RlmE family RNA methyltransferase [Candidatus Lightella neohaematopini]